MVRAHARRGLMPPFSITVVIPEGGCGIWMIHADLRTLNRSLGGCGVRSDERVEIRQQADAIFNPAFVEVGRRSSTSVLADRLFPRSGQKIGWKSQRMFRGKRQRSFELVLRGIVGKHQIGLGKLSSACLEPSLLADWRGSWADGHLVSGWQR